MNNSEIKINCLDGRMNFCIDIHGKIFGYKKQQFIYLVQFVKCDKLLTKPCKIHVGLSPESG